MYQKTELKNGLTLITAPLRGTKAVTVLVLVKVGSRYETKDINGTFHFIEHMMFKGTRKRPTSLDITKELDSVGAEYNAFTAKDHTGYHIKISADKIQLAFDVLSDILFNSKFDENELGRERKVILQEIKMYEDNPIMYIEHLFENTIFAGQPLGWLVSGSKSTVKKLSRQKILNAKNSFYHPSNMTVVVAGQFDKSKVKKLVNQYFDSAKAKRVIRNFRKISITQIKPQVAINFKDTNQSQLCLGFPGYSFSHHHIYALYLLTVVLGGNMSSRLFTTIRERYGLAYFIKATTNVYQDAGSFIIQAGLDKSRVKQAIQLILGELKKIKEKGITPEELKSAKEFLKGKIVLELEDSEEVADWYGKQQSLLNKILTPQQKLKKVFSVKLNDIKEVASDIFREDKLNLVLIGPFRDKKKFLKLLHF